MGYLLPENVSPADYICLRVYIPNDELYLEAFSGQFHELSTWLAWDRDGTSRASQAAARWKDAIDYTYLHGWLKCGGTLDSDIIRRIEELENMVINVNCGGGCGGCGGGCGGGCQPSDNTYPNDPSVPPLPTLPAPTPTPGQTTDWCDRSNEIASRYVSIFQTLDLWWTGTTATVQGVETWLTTMLEGFAPILWPFILTQIATAITFIVSNGWVEQAKTAAEGMKDNLICAVYNSNDALSAKIAFDGVVDVQSSGLGTIVRAILKLPTFLIDWSKVVDMVGIPTDPIYVGSTCNCGGGGGAPIPTGEPIAIDPIDDKYYLVPVDMDDPVNPSIHSGLLSNVDNLWEWTIEGNYTKYERHNLFSSLYVVPSPTDATLQHGFLLQLVQGNSNLSFGTWLAGGTTMNAGSLKLDELGGDWFYIADAATDTLLLNYLAGYSIVPVRIPNSSSPYVTREYVQLQTTAVGGVAQTLSYRYWSIVDVEAVVP